MSEILELNHGCERLEPDERFKGLVPEKLPVESYRDETGLIRHVIFLPLMHIDVCTEDLSLLTDDEIRDRLVEPALNHLGECAKWRCELLKESNR